MVDVMVDGRPLFKIHGGKVKTVLGDSKGKSGN
jgi:hypothetical protein